MKKIGFLLIIVLGFTTVTYGQKTKTTTVYVNTFDGDHYPVLNSFSEYKKGERYSKINKALLRKESKITNKDTEVTYYFKINLKTILNGTRYKVKRTTPVLN